MTTASTVKSPTMVAMRRSRAYCATMLAHVHEADFDWVAVRIEPFDGPPDVVADGVRIGACGQTHVEGVHIVGKGHEGERHDGVLQRPEMDVGTDADDHSVVQPVSNSDSFAGKQVVDDVVPRRVAVVLGPETLTGKNRNAQHVEEVAAHRTYVNHHLLTVDFPAPD